MERVSFQNDGVYGTGGNWDWEIGGIRHGKWGLLVGLQVMIDMISMSYYYRIIR